MSSLFDLPTHSLRQTEPDDDRGEDLKGRIGEACIAERFTKDCHQARCGSGAKKRIPSTVERATPQHDKELRKDCRKKADAEIAPAENGRRYRIKGAGCRSPGGVAISGGQGLAGAHTGPGPVRI